MMPDRVWPQESLLFQFIAAQFPALQLIYYIKEVSALHRTGNYNKLGKCAAQGRFAK